MEKEHKTEKSETDESGHSEKKSDLELEIQAGEWQSLSRFKTYQDRSRQGKIIAMHKAVSNRLNQLTKLYYDLVSQDVKGGEKLLEELRKLRQMQDVLLQCLIWTQEGSSSREMEKRVPKEVWELIE